jgi:hypothetical protein
MNNDDGERLRHNDGALSGLGIFVKTDNPALQAGL